MPRSAGEDPEAFDSKGGRCGVAGEEVGEFNGDRWVDFLRGPEVISVAGGEGELGRRYFWFEGFAILPLELRRSLDGEGRSLLLSLSRNFSLSLL